MEKNRNRFREAMRIYERGISLFPRVAKLREDAGILAARMGKFDKAVDLLKAALSICRSTDQAGEKGVLLALGRTFYKMDTVGALRESVIYFEAALSLFTPGVRPPHKDLFQFRLA